MQGLWVYILGFTISTFLITLAEKSSCVKAKKWYKNSFIIIALLIPICISGFRFSVGTDYNTYVSLYNKYATCDLRNIFTVKEVEPFFIIVCKLAYILRNVNIVFFIYAILTVTFIFAAIWNEKDKISISLAFFLYMYLYFGGSMNIMRQALAVAVAMFSYKYVINRKFVKFILLAILAISVHKTAIVILPLLFMIRNGGEQKKKSRVFTIMKICFIVGFVAIVLNIEYFLNIIGQIEYFEKYNVYVQYEGESRNLSLILNLLVYSFITFFIKNMIKYDRNNEYYYYLISIGLVFGALGYKSPYLKRVSNYFNILEILLLATIPKIVKEKKQKQIIILGIIAYAVIRFILTVYILKQGDLVPYRTIFEK